MQQSLKQPGSKQLYIYSLFDVYPRNYTATVWNGAPDDF